MLENKTIDETLIELARTMKALQALRAARKEDEGNSDQWRVFDRHKENAAAKRASLDLTRKLADLRAGK